ncbi:2-dehydro-3-deoxy-phosphogluconate aldolase [Bartonella tamiae]|uniref:2-dehydro-3-deoxy-phosphogluconate aldolase n=1 Tax=Bartonella tamiae Th239 TaxID=1094558 RepID=J0ZLP0_9HYPH|nr:2-dehydro-3-deoxy-phosphogluconate aldolase [Bartonella tamiae]EJF89338.1 2-dehydro-3-deoxyphosphogluconate aldolase/4-hydroxy-2-oxoglutarate aldolase [Bartonella tamiae Th239]EJF92797.1 2-dehydro-3-deoxyphosphogluconate aldolase/4-hydroxy-2-oxoglutarate aldolase [Bartonella tamiae Th307]
MAQKTEQLLPILEGQTVIPVLLVDAVEDAVPLARALAKGGLKAIEVTLRTPVALDAIRDIAENVEEAIVGAGTVLNIDHFEAAQIAGAKFIVSPGLTGELIDIAEDSHIPLLPGAITPSEIMAALEEGYNYLKFFPAEAAGGINFVKSLASPFGQVKFCPTGGISQNNAKEWLNMDNVVCVGGSWIAPKELTQTKNWEAITKLAKEANSL